MPENKRLQSSLHHTMTKKTGRAAARDAEKFMLQKQTQANGKTQLLNKKPIVKKKKKKSDQ